MKLSTALAKFSLAFSVVCIIGCGNSDRSSPSSAPDNSRNNNIVQEEPTYNETKSTLENQERANPLDFLSTNGTYRDQVLGTKKVLEGTISNAATIVTYKDVVLEVTYYSKTNSIIGTETLTLYDYFPPRKKKSFTAKTKAPDKTASIGWEITYASVQ